MATGVVMPALEMAQETGKLVKWYKREGEDVAKGDLLMAIETDKAVVELEAEAAGTLAAVRAAEGDVVAVGQVIAWILNPGETPPADAAQPTTGRAMSAASVAAPAPAPAAAARSDTERPLLSPKARRLAAERGVDLRELKGSGPGGAVVADDLQAAAAPGAEEPGTVWRIMADRVTAAWTTVPQFFVTREVDAGALIAWRARVAGRQTQPGGDVTFTDLLVALAARTIAGHRRLNASWVRGRIQYHDAVNVGIATAIEQGLVVPVIHGAGAMSVAAIAGRRQELVERARAGRLQPADIAGGTFTISNLGMYAVDGFNAIVNAPQSAILAVGRIVDRVVAHEGRPAVRPRMSVTLSCDHRVVDGARAAEFLADLASAIENPEGVLGEA